MDYLLIHPILTLSITSAIIAIIFAGLIFELYRRWGAVFGTQATTSQGALQEIVQRLLAAEERLGALEPRVDVLEKIGSIAVQKVGFLRFNPFEHTGGDQSFAVALLDRENHGIVLSSLYTREGVRIYAKEIQSGVSRHALSDEEKTVLAQAMGHS